MKHVAKHNWTRRGQLVLSRLLNDDVTDLLANLAWLG